MRQLDLKGQKFNRLTVVGFAIIKNQKTYWKCRCDCGKVKIICGCDLKSGSTKSCGCYRNEQITMALSTHGKTKTKEYYAWINMRTRCYNVNNKYYNDYGGRGISVCERWIRSFENFLEDMGKKPYPNYSLERKDYNKGYSKENCKWADAYEQSKNKRNNKWFKYGGKRMILQDWAKYFGINQANLIISIRSKGFEGVYNYYHKKYNGIFPNKEYIRPNKYGQNYNKSIGIIAYKFNSLIVSEFNSIRNCSKITKVHHQVIRKYLDNGKSYMGWYFNII